MFGIRTIEELDERFPVKEVSPEQVKKILRRQIYREAARTRFKDKIAGPMFNDTFEDSQDIYETIFDFCSEEVTIFARGIKKEILCQTPVLDSSKNFLSKKDTKLTMHLPAKSVAAAHSKLDNIFIRNLENRFFKRGTLKVNFYKGQSEAWVHKEPSITIGDDLVYRFRDDQPSESDFLKNGNATVDFNNPEKVEAYKNRIKNILDNEQLIFTHTC